MNDILTEDDLREWALFRVEWLKRVGLLVEL